MSTVDSPYLQPKLQDAKPDVGGLFPHSVVDPRRGNTRSSPPPGAARARPLVKPVPLPLSLPLSPLMTATDAHRILKAQRIHR